MMLFISWSLIKIYGLSNTHSCFLKSLMNTLEEYPLSIFIPLIISTYVLVVWLFSTVTMSTSLKASAIILPTSLSLFALIVATSTSFLPLNFFDRLSNL